MKKLVAGVLATTACLSVGTFVACKDNVKVDVNGAANALYSAYVEQNVEGRTNYYVPNVFSYQGYDYKVTWAVAADDESVNIDDAVKLVQRKTAYRNETKVDVNEVAEDDVDYTLTATVAAGKETKDVVFARTLTAAPWEVPASIMAAPVENTPYKFYVYQAATNTDCYINGEMKNDYYFATDTNSDYGVTIYTETVSGGFNVYHKGVGGEDTEKTYINIVKSGNYTNVKYQDTASSVWTYSQEYGTIVTKVGDDTYYMGCDGTYNTVEPQKTRGEGYYMGYLVEMKDRNQVTDEAKAERTVQELALNAVYVGEGEHILEEQGALYGEAKVSYAVKNGSGVSIDTEILTLKAGSSASTVELTATVKCGDVTKTKDLSFKLIPNEKSAILDAAFALKDNEEFANKVTLTGKVTGFMDDGEYTDEYGTISVYMDVDGKQMGAYRMNGIGVKDVQPGYTITVTGTLVNYKGGVQFDFACTLDSYEEGTLPEAPQLTPAEIVDAAYALEQGASMQGEQTLTGVITEIKTPYDSGFKNISVVIVVANKTDKPILCYRLKGTDADKLAVGDTITVTGTIKNYSGTIEFDSGCTFTNRIPGEGGNQGGGTTNPPATENKKPVAITSAPAVDTAYKLYMYQANKAAVYYLKGGMSGYYLATTTASAEAVDVFAETAEGGFYLYYMDEAAKKYITVAYEMGSDNNMHTNVKFEDTASSVWVWNTEISSVVTTVDGKVYYLGNYGSYETMRASEISYASTSYVAYLCTLEDGTFVPPATEDDDDNQGGGTTNTPVTGGTLYDFNTYTAHADGNNQDQQFTKKTSTLDDITMTVSNGCLYNATNGTTDLRLYKTGTQEGRENPGEAIFECGKVVDAISLEVKGSAAITVYGSVDGETWTEIEVFTPTSSKKTYTMEIADSAYTYVKLVNSTATANIYNMTLKYAE